jgi:type II secretory pathway pseudopilin PulG
VTRAAGPRGLTIVEFLVATSIVAFAILGVASMFPAALQTVIRGGQTTKATMLAQGMADIIRSEPFDVLVTRYNNLDTQTLGVSCPLDETSAPPPYDDYTKKKWACDLRLTGAQDSGQGLPGASGRVRVECVDASGAVVACPSGLRRVTVTVLWGENPPQSVRVVSHVARIR